MKLIKIMPDKIQIRTNDDEFKKARLNDLISISDGDVKIVTMVSAITDSTVEATAEEDINDFLMGFEQPSIKVLECSILGSVINGKFSSSIDKYPTTDIKAEVMNGQDFADMLSSRKASSFVIGKYSNYDCDALIDGNKFYQRHSCIVGNTGCGKSETVTKIMEETVNGTNCNMIVFDIHGEYSNLSYVDSVKVGNEFPFPIWMLGFSDMVSNVFKLKEETATVAMSALRKSYRYACPGGNENKPIYFNFDRMLEYMCFLNTEMVGTGEFYKTGDKAGQEKTVKGDYNGKLSGIINTMETLYLDKRYQFLFENESQNYLNEFINRIMAGEKCVKTIDLSDVPHDIALLIIGVIANLVYSIQIMQKAGNITPITLVCDEAHVYIPVDFQLSASQRRLVKIFENIAKEGRKFGITLFVASQRPSELNRTIMAQCANYIVMKLNNENDKTMIKGMLPEGNNGIIETTTMFFPGDALVIGDAMPIPMKIHVQLAKERPQSKTIDFWTEWKAEKHMKTYDHYLGEYLAN